jgi:hypothetical protein
MSSSGRLVDAAHADQKKNALNGIMPLNLTNGGSIQNLKKALLRRQTHKPKSNVTLQVR